MSALNKKIYTKRTKDYGENRFKSDYESERESNYMDIWRINPSYRDINTKLSIVRLTFIIPISITIFLTALFRTKSIYFGIVASFPFLFCLFFNQVKYIIQNVISLSHRAFFINPFRELGFFIVEDEPSTLLFINKKVSSTIALRIFKVAVLPENVQPTLNQFLKALNNSKLTFTYQVVQTPIFNKKDSSIENEAGLRTIVNSTSKISIYFSVYYHKEGILTRNKLNELLDIVRDYSNELKTVAVANIHHTKIQLLQKLELISAIRSMTGFNLDKLESINQLELPKKFYSSIFINKIMFMIPIVIIISQIMASVNIHPFLIIIVDIALFYFFFFIWWRELLYFFSNRTLSGYEDIKLLELYPDIQFFQLRSLKNMLFANIQNKILMGVKILNFYNAIQPMLAYPDKFFRSINNQQINFNYLVNASPIDSKTFSKECFKYLNDKTKNRFIRHLDTREPDFRENENKISSPEEFLNWLEIRSGIWKTFLIIAATFYEKIEDLTKENIFELSLKLDEKARILKKSFEDNYLRIKLTETKRNDIINGFLLSAIKTTEFNHNNTFLNYFYFQGKNLINLITLSNEFKKGLDTKIAAEFNSPLHLINDIIIGKTINTEVLESEVELGLKYNQIKQLLITNGLPEQREAIMMRILFEVIQKKIPSIIFDFSGNWSKIVSQFDKTEYANSFLSFKLGYSFSLELINSDIDYDPDNVEYLSLFYDVFALAFKEQRKTLDLMKIAVHKNEDLGLATIELDQQMEDQTYKKHDYNSLITTLQGFINWRKYFTTNLIKSDHEIKTIDFIRNDKTIIIDLSLLEEISQKLFVSFVIISKFIHYTKKFEDYLPKLIFIPNIDLFFDEHFIDNYINSFDYGKINRFVSPLLQKGFGLVFSSNQVRYLHHNLLNFFPNIITFRATDKRDISVLKNQMNLQELHGAGYYSSKRNNTYQIDYLMNLQEKEVIIKRSDIYQPFPGIIDFKKFTEAKRPSQEYITTYMKKQGYNLEDHEHRILSRAKETLFEKDLGIYVDFIEDIINFLSAISSLDKIGGLYEPKLKEELLKYIDNTASKKNQNRKKIKDLRNSIFQILKVQGYLVEYHPPRPSGGESVRTCYKVGDKYRKALEDYYATKTDIDTKYNSKESKIKENSNSLERFEVTSNCKIINENELNQILNSKISELLFNLYNIHKLLNKKEFHQSLSYSGRLIDSFLTELYNEYMKIPRIKNSLLKDINSFINILTETGIIPYTREELKEFSKKAENLTRNVNNIEKNAFELFELLMHFYKNLDNHNKGDNF